MKKYTLEFTKKELEILMNEFNNLSTACEGYDLDPQKQAQKALKVFDRALKKIGLKRNYI